MTRTDVYWHQRRQRWSLRVDKRVVDHLPTLALAGCRMVVREAERQRCVVRRQRNVHAWIQGRLIEPPRIDEAFLQIGYSPWHVGAFTIRPGFLPIFEANLVSFLADGTAWAFVSDQTQMETAS
ncbi:hypothetical protein [Microvirga arabica]|uniref:hypothetical protein n=1 Tax=Microvirga arabica TaxID=1128671 RepID=UPI001939616C|nr:hypothetical protein [Microvirga arabica]MBM1170186.1 hypothetical protein [Microvirga arabica]